MLDTTTVDDHLLQPARPRPTDHRCPSCGYGVAGPPPERCPLCGRTGDPWLPAWAR